ncbi:cytochrome P450 [Mycena maculata]|uniref:Cytochrome P450 n=1 Tax=Mycena maculata TaxID=230809 RepID=A0AAD7J1S4_9AGAR|nr:cytochrome P450 [Mycena maculata]
MISSSAFWASVTLAGAAYTYWRLRKKSFLKDIRGPKPTSWLYGHQIEMQQSNVGELDFAWEREYKGAWKVGDCFGREILMLTDPGAINYVVHKRGYAYPKTRPQKQLTRLFFGRGVAWAAGQRHALHRKVLNPAFTVQSIRAHFPVFRRVASQLSALWADQIQESDVSSAQRFDISKGLTRAALDIIGESVFDYHFGSLNDDNDFFSSILNNLFADSTVHPPPAAILFTGTWAFIPESILQFVAYLPARQFVRFREFLSVGKRLGAQLLGDKGENSATDRKKNDILSILVQANESNEVRNRLDSDEILSQITTLLLAGHESTSATMIWLLYELAYHPDDQTRLRAEIMASRQSLAGHDFSVTELENLPFLNACIKEVLRYHPISPWITRQSAEHDVILLSAPLLTKSGTYIDEIEVGPHQQVLISTCGYNRLESVFGEDASQWNPSRFLDPALRDGKVSIGLYANLLTFSGGPSGCIGYRFAILEMLAVIVELIEKFEFAPPPDRPVMQRVRAGAVMAPFIKDKFEERVQMPLSVSLAQVN